MKEGCVRIFERPWTVVIVCVWCVGRLQGRWNQSMSASVRKPAVLFALKQKHWFLPSEISLDSEPASLPDTLTSAMFLHFFPSSGMMSNCANLNVRKTVSSTEAAFWCLNLLLFFLPWGANRCWGVDNLKSCRGTCSRTSETSHHRPRRYQIHPALPQHVCKMRPRHRFIKWFAETFLYFWSCTDAKFKKKEIKAMVRHTYTLTHKSIVFTCISLLLTFPPVATATQHLPPCLTYSTCSCKTHTHVHSGEPECTRTHTHTQAKDRKRAQVYHTLLYKNTKKKGRVRRTDCKSQHTDC